MTTFPDSPRLLKSGQVLIDLDASTVRRVIVLQHNPASLSRTLQAQTKWRDSRMEGQAIGDST